MQLGAKSFYGWRLNRGVDIHLITVRLGVKNTILFEERKK